ncbi:hypothetical protein ACFLU6_15860, partial [Acidobacteriota bacterium]
MSAEKKSKPAERTPAGRIVRIAVWLVALIVVIVLVNRFSLVERLTGKSNPLPTTKAERTGLKITVEAEGELRAVNTTACYIPRIPRHRRIKIIWMIDEGEKVKTGQPIFKLEPQEIIKELKEEQFKFQTAQKEYEKEEAELKTRLGEIELQIESAQMNVEKQEMKVRVDPSVESHLKLQEAGIDLEIARKKLDALYTKKKAIEDEGRAKLAYYSSKRDLAGNKVDRRQQYIDSLN